MRRIGNNKIENSSHQSSTQLGHLQQCLVLVYGELRLRPFQKKRLRRAGRSNNDLNSRICDDITRPLSSRQYSSQARSATPRVMSKSNESCASITISPATRSSDEFQREFAPFSRGERTRKRARPELPTSDKRALVHVSRRATSTKYWLHARRPPQTSTAAIFYHIFNTSHLTLSTTTVIKEKNIPDSDLVGGHQYYPVISLRTAPVPFRHASSHRSSQ